MKKLWCLIFVTVLLIITGCSKAEDENQKNGAAQVGTQKQEELSYVQGNWKDRHYENPALGLQGDIPENWNIASQQEIDQLLKAGNEQMTEEQQKAFEKQKENISYEFLLYTEDAKSNVQLCVEKSVITDPDVYIKGTIAQLKKAGAEYSFSDISDAVIGGQTFRMVKVTASVGIVQNYYVKEHGDYIVLLVASGLDEDIVNELTAFLKPL